jgi:hypothetical protein
MRDCAMCFSVAPGLDRWTEYAPMVIGMEVPEPGDQDGNGLVRVLQYKLPFGRIGTAHERVSDVVPQRSYCFEMGFDRPNSQTGAVRLVSLAPNRTRLDFEERFHLTRAPRKWFEAPIYRFINRKNEASMRGFSLWLVDHPDFRPDLIERENGE